MRRRFHTKTAAWSSLALYAVLSVGVSDLVLCVGSDGHVAIESRFAEDCCDQAPGTRAPVQIAVDDGCDCTDASLLQPAAGVRPGRAPVTLGTALPAAPADGGIAALPPLATVSHAWSPGGGSPPLRALRTVVLVV